MNLSLMLFTLFNWWSLGSSKTALMRIIKKDMAIFMAYSNDNATETKG